MFLIPGRHLFILTNQSFYAIQAWKRDAGFTGVKDTFFMYKIFQQVATDTNHWPFWTNDVSPSVFPYGPFVQYGHDMGFMYRLSFRNLKHYIRYFKDCFTMGAQKRIRVIWKVMVSLPTRDPIQYEQLRRLSYKDGRFVTKDLVPADSIQGPAKNEDGSPAEVFTSSENIVAFPGK